MLAAAVPVPLLLLAGCNPPETRRPDGAPDPRATYSLYCAGCHGDDGSKGEPEARLVDAAHKPEPELRAVIETGRGAMPGWRGRLKEDEITVLVHYVRRFRPDAPPR